MSSIFGSRKPAPSPVVGDSKPETIIGPTTSLQGDLKADGALRVDGVIEGNVTAAGNVIVGQTGRVTGAVAGQHVLIAGAVRGNVTATGRLEIVATGKVWGDINVRALLIEEGGLFRGQSVMRDESTPLEALPEPAHLEALPERGGAPATGSRVA